MSPQLLADFFVRHVTPEYVSHAEIQIGRAHSDGTWSGNLVSLLVHEFAAALSPQNLQPLYQTRAFAGYEDDELVCVGMVGFHLADGGPYAVVEDLIVHSAKRAAKYGTQALDWVESSIKTIGVAMLFCETGTSNSLAKTFFQRRGLQPVSIVLVKKLPPALSSETGDDWSSKVWHLSHESH